MRFHTRSLIHPGQGAEALGKGAAQIFDQLHHLGAMRRREMTLDIDSANRLTKQGTDKTDAALFTLALGFDAVEALLMKLEMRPGKRLGKQRGVVVDPVEGMPG